MTEERSVDDGRKLERLSEFFIALEDVNLPMLFSFRQEQLDDLRCLFDQIVQQLVFHCSLEQLRKLALLVVQITSLPVGQVLRDPLHIVGAGGWFSLCLWIDGFIRH